MIPLVRDTDRAPHQPISWRRLLDAVRREFPAGRTGPENFYRGDSAIPGEYVDAAGASEVRDESRRYLLAIPRGDVSRLRILLRRAAVTFDQRSIYLAVAGVVEFVRPDPDSEAL